MNMMSSHRGRRRDTLPGPWKIVVGVMCVLMLLFFVLPVFDGAVQRLDVHIWRASHSLRSSVQARTSSKKQLLKDIEVLNEYIGTLEIERAQYTGRIEFIEELRAMESGEALVGIITSRPPELLHDIFIVDRGRRHGVVEGARVFAREGVLLGEVAEVFGRTAKVMAYTSPDVMITGFYEGADTAVDLMGRGDGTFVFEVPREVEVEEGEIIVDQSAERHILGVIDSIEFDDRDPLQTVFVRVPVSYRQIRWVQIEVLEGIE